MKRYVFLVAYQATISDVETSGNGWLYAEGERPTVAEVKEWQDDMNRRYLSTGLSARLVILNLIPLAPL